tara:strand:+ start:2414 stop:3310 length:897 start_codon:yes stop_codon:yes gene_type:complete
MKPIIKWVGGKTQILDHVFDKFPSSMNNYYEVFLGGGSVLFELLERCKSGEIQVSGNIYAYDKNPVLINMFINIKDNHFALLDAINHFLNIYSNCETDKGSRNPSTEEEAIISKESYYYWLRTKYNQMTHEEQISIQGSALFIFLNKTCFRGLYRVGPNGLNVPFGNYLKLNNIISIGDLTKMSNDIQNVNFGVADFGDVLNNCSEGDFIYVDPPYVPITKTSFVNYASGGFGENEHDRLFHILQNLNTHNIKFLMSNSNCEKVANAFLDYNISEIECRRAINSKKPDSTTSELLISN